MDDERDRYPGNLPNLLRTIEARTDQHHEQPDEQHDENPDEGHEAVGTVGGPVDVQRNANTPRTRGRWFGWLPVVYLVMSAVTCMDLAFAPDSESSGAPVLPGHRAAVTPMSPSAGTP